MDRKRIPARLKRRQNTDRLAALKIADKYEKRLIKARTAVISKALKLSKTNSIEAWTDVIPQAVSEPYLSGMMRGLLMQCGPIGAKEILDRFTVRPKADKDLWQYMYEQWVGEHIGDEIVSIEATMKEWLQGEVAKVAEEAANWGVEKATKRLYAHVSGQWKDTAVWMCRRIMQTETMNSLAFAAYECTQSLNLDVVKTWSTSGLRNTRDTHKVMDGVSVDMNETFSVPRADGGPDDVMRFPHDGTLGASAGNIINCACTCIYLPK